MPKIIKKKPARKKAAQENEVKSAALQALDKIKQRQKQVVTGVSVVVALIIFYVIFAVYSSSMSKEAYSLEMEAYNIYYSDRSEESIEKPMSEEDRWKKALDLYKKSVDIKATPTALYYLGNCYFNLKDYDNAIKEYNLLVDKFSGKEGILPLVYQKLASAYFKTDQNEKALETLAKLAGVDDGIFRDTALILEAGYFEGAGEKEKALEKYREIISKFPVSPWSAEAGSKVAAEEAANAKETTKESEVEKEEEKPDKE